MTPDAMHILEELIDQYSLAEVLEALSEICTGKAEHVRTNWQDEKLAKIWLRNARKLDTLRMEHQTSWLRLP